MGMSSPRKKKGSSSAIMAEINITPLTDIFLVLLIIFMVTSVAMVQSGANINLPEVEETKSEPRQIVITVTCLLTTPRSHWPIWKDSYDR